MFRSPSGAFAFLFYLLGLKKELYLRIRTQIATKEYASRVPMDMRSTRAARSKKKAIKAGEASVEIVSQS